MPYITRILCLLCLVLLIPACSSSFKTPYATGHYVSRPVQCVPYARSKSGINLYGDAYTWWDQAGVTYQRGNIPAVGSVLVLSQTNRMTHGHVAVVKKILNSREIDVTHSNWGNDWKTRRIIYDTVRVQDVSSTNDWSFVRFWNHGQGSFGFPYATSGFIYHPNSVAQASPAYPSDQMMPDHALPVSPENPDLHLPVQTAPPASWSYPLE